MRNFKLVKWGMVTVVLFSLTGCDWLQGLLGMGPKKAQEVKPVSQVAAPAAPAAQVPQASSAPSVPMPSDAMVRIGSWTLTVNEFNNRISLLKQQLPDFKENDANARNAVLDELIRQELLVKEAEDSDLGNTKEIKDAVEDFRKTLLVQDIASKLTKDVSATDDDAKAYYEANKEKFRQPVTWHAREIIVDNQAAAKDVLVQVLQGTDFGELAQTRSKGPNASTGGKLKAFTAAPFEAMQTAIANLDAGGVSGVFKGPEGYYIVKVDSKTGGELKPLADLKKDLIYGLTMQKQQAVILNHLRDLADKEKPEYNKELINQIVGKPTQ